MFLSHPCGVRRRSCSRPISNGLRAKRDFRAARPTPKPGRNSLSQSSVFFTFQFHGRNILCQNCLSQLFRTRGISNGDARTRHQLSALHPEFGFGIARDAATDSAAGKSLRAIARAKPRHHATGVAIEFRFPIGASDATGSPVHRAPCLSGVSRVVGRWKLRRPGRTVFLPRFASSPGPC